MNVLIPLGGVGSRFASEGYVRPKPLIRVLGKEMIFWVLESLNVGCDDQVLIIYLPDFLGMDFERIVHERYPKVRFLQLKHQTRGAAETVMYGLQALPPSSLARPAVLIDGDAFYTVDVLARFRAVAEDAGAVFCFEAPHDEPIFSYVSREQDDSITDIREKEMISRWANCGTYCFQNGEELLKRIQGMLARNLTQRGEFYTSGVIKIMLDDGRPFKAIEVDRQRDFHVLGTPLQVEEFCKDWPAQPAKRWCFDLDGTLLSPPKVPGDIGTCTPIHHMVQVVQDLHKAGHVIVIHTSRQLKAHADSDAGAANDIGIITIDSLHEFNIPYHELYFGKPHAHFYVDSLAVDPLRTRQTVAKQTGFHPTLVKAKFESSCAHPPQHTQRILPWTCMSSRLSYSMPTWIRHFAA